MYKLDFQMPVLGKISLYCKEKNLFNFTKRQFYAYMYDKDETYDKIDSDFLVEIETEIDFEKCGIGFYNGSRSRQFTVQGGEIYYRHIVIHKMDNNKICVRVKGNVSKEKDADLKKCYAEYHSRFYDKILFPIFAIYAINNNCFLLHGSLLKVGGNNILVCGLDGVGKSSISSELQKKGAKILADNFVLFNGKEAIPLNLTMRLGPSQTTNMKVIYRDDNLQEVIENYHDNNVVALDQIYLLSIGDKFSVANRDISLLSLILYLNNAPEIGGANMFIGPFLWNVEIGIKKLNWDKNITILNIPLGELNRGVEVIWNDSKVFSR